MKTICVFAGSCSPSDPFYLETATALGRALAQRGDTMLFGGGTAGLMGAVARAVHQHHGKVIGVVPRTLNRRGVIYEACDELIVARDLRHRKAIMEERSDGFIALPGGYGTLEELLEIITLKQLHCHEKPIVIFNHNGFYNQLLQQFDHLIGQGFAVAANRRLYLVTASLPAGLDYLDSRP